MVPAGAAETTEAPLSVAAEAGQQAATGEEVLTITPVVMGDEVATLTVGVRWSVAHWYPGRPTTTFGGDVLLTVHVVHVNGAWLAQSVDPA